MHSTYIWHVNFGTRAIQLREDGESLRAYFERVDLLRLRSNGKLDMRFRSSRAIAREELAPA